MFAARSSLLVVLALAAGCRHQADPRDEAGRRVLRLGYLPNVTHAPALWALESGALARELGPEAVVRARAFAAGPAIVEALFAGELDAAYLGPNPAINAHQKSRGRAVRTIAGAAFGGAQLVVRSSLSAAEELSGQRVASPGLGNTQDVALRRWLSGRGIAAQVMPISPPEILQLFGRGELAGAWVPEPWASRMVVELGGRVLVDERDLWPGGRFPSSVLVAATSALQARPELIDALLRAHEEAVRALFDDPSAPRLVGAALARELGRPLPAEVLERAFEQLSFSSQLPEVELARLAGDAHALGFIKTPDVVGLASRGPLR